MMRRISRYLRLGLVSALCMTAAAPVAQAHRAGIPVTTLEWHEPSGLWHLVHKLSVHDFAPEIEGVDTGALEHAEGQALLGRYVLNHFALTGQTAAIEVSYLGAEEEADSFYVYFQISSPDQVVEIENRLAEPGGGDERRHALVNLTTDKHTQTLLFTARDGSKLLDLTRPS